jgi:hypothetical protein
MSDDNKWPELTIDRLMDEFSVLFFEGNSCLLDGLEFLVGNGLSIRDIASLLYASPLFVDIIKDLDFYKALDYIQATLEKDKEELKPYPPHIISVYLEDGFSIHDIAWLYRNIIGLSEINNEMHARKCLNMLHNYYSHGGQRIHNLSTYMS